ncbi:hypothetical protein FA15DRAFT_676342 [Coprinopsis marcescibilis]|uniref:Uncharacterized protein n=1 Tax=Coprinopsis marcescibilis TaxID=230819 RepID=A0A5C3KAP3_COPMA|nr:hypothetical protein FA15DRAFT_676342 [Coprinopsis marcescibilis]
MLGDVDPDWTVPTGFEIRLLFLSFTAAFSVSILVAWFLPSSILFSLPPTDRADCFAII